MHRHSSWMRRPITAGKRWIAGLAQHTATNSSTSIEAICAGVEVPEPLAQRVRTGERPLHRHLLVEQHPDEQRRAVAVEQPVGLGVAGDVERAGHRANVPFTLRSPHRHERARRHGDGRHPAAGGRVPTLALPDRPRGRDHAGERFPGRVPPPAGRADRPGAAPGRWGIAGRVPRPRPRLQRRVLVAARGRGGLCRGGGRRCRGDLRRAGPVGCSRRVA